MLARTAKPWLGAVACAALLWAAACGGMGSAAGGASTQGSYGAAQATTSATSAGSDGSYGGSSGAYGSYGASTGTAGGSPGTAVATNSAGAPASAAGTGSAATSTGASGAGTAGGKGAAATVHLASNAKLGMILADSSGATLYEYEADGVGRSVCTAACAQNWPPLTAAASPAGSGVTGTLATLKRADGTSQVTCNGEPLYRFAGDKQAGDTNGQGIAGKWYTVRADCAKVGEDSGS